MQLFPHIRIMGKKGVFTVTYLSIVLIAILRTTGAGILYPFESESRNTQFLDGIWNFRLASTVDSDVGHREQWYRQSLKETGSTIPMPVPSSYNDITEDKSIRDHVGVVWYDRDFYVPKQWSYDNLKVWLRFGSVHYQADVYVNGELVVSHSGGHIAFQAEVTSVLNFGGKNLISVAVNNSLTDITVPQGHLSSLTTDQGSKVIQQYTFDFFNYAGIHRSVLLYTTPETYIDDISVNTDVNGDTGIITYEVTVVGSSETPVLVSLLDKEGNYVQLNVLGASGTLQIVIEKPLDIYRLPVGIRKLEWNNDTVTINGKPLYIRGFGRHEDSSIRGKGHDFPLITRDYNLLKWVGANAYRTSHYPYSEEIMDFADKEGIMIIDECPGVNIGGYGFKNDLLEAHKTALSELYQRDKNRPSVVMWSIANEALTGNSGADTYFSAVADHIKSLDKSRPITMAFSASPESDKTGEFVDVIGFNRYNAWYSNDGYTDTIKVNVKSEASRWRNKYNKPVIMTEYGADTMVGLHLSPDYIWSEEFQITVLSKHFQAFDELREEGYFIGEMIWNFADFNTAQTYTRVGGNRKGIFTRDRQPKAGAHFTRKRYWALAEELDNATLPEDLNDYISAKSWKQMRNDL
ncbi:Beta-glucuronidase [Blattella germanica]|nr:Beta-glucuronidase [Blattella germanica]